MNSNSNITSDLPNTVAPARIRVLMLATYFPKPGRDTIGSWALDQAQSLVESGIDLKVVSLTPWLPRGVFRSDAGRAIADCPPEFQWGTVQTLYPRWPYYHMNPVRRWSYANPLPFLNAAFRVAKAGLLKVMEDFKPDIVFAHHSAVNGFVAARLKALTGVPFIVTDHSFEEIEACYKFPRRRAAYEYVAENASCMIGVCARMERQIAKLLPAARTRTVHNGFPDFPAGLLLNPRPAALQDKLVIFSAGMFYTRKNFPLLIDVFAKVSAVFPNAVLRIAGDGAEMDLVKNKVAEHKLQGKVELLGLIPRTRVLQEVAWSDVFALIGRDEPFGVVFLEALSAAVPIVCCSDCGITDIVSGGRDAMIVPPGDLAAAVESLCALLRDEALRKRIGAAGLELFRGSLRGSANAAAIGELIHEAIGKPVVSTIAA